MMPVARKPILERIVEGLVATGIRRFLIVTGYQAEAVENHFGDGACWGANISYVRQPVTDGTGHAVELAREFAGLDAFLLACGDILVTNATYEALLRDWEKADWDGMLAVKLGEDTRHGGLEIFGETFCLKELVEKPTEPEWVKSRQQYGNIQPWYNAGIYIFTPRIFEYTARLKPSPRGEYELTDAIQQMAQDGLRLKGHVIEDFWVDVRDPSALARADEYFENRP